MRATSAVIGLLLSASCGRLGFEPLRAQTDGSTCATDAAADAPSGPTFYVGTTGSDGNPGTSPTTAWATFAHAFTVIGPGDILVILDGTYTEPLLVGTSGAPGMPVTVRAEHDGGVIIDGRNMVYPCSFRGNLGANVHDLVIEGVSCRNTLDTTTQNGEAALLVFYADRVTVRRCTVTGAIDVLVEVAVASDILLEDIAAWGQADNGLTILQGSRVTVRRAYIHWQAGNTDGTAFDSSESSDGRFENNYIVTQPGTAGVWVGLEVYSDSMPSDRNVVTGNIVLGTGLNQAFGVAGSLIDITGNVLTDNVAIGTSGLGLFQRGDTNLVVTRFTAVGPDPGIELVAQGTSNMAMTLTSSMIVQASTGLDETPDPRILGFTHHHNVFFEVPTLYSGTTAGASEVTLDPGYDVARYGTGAYLVRPPALANLGDAGPAGAEILYRTVDGVLTTTPLWPWPMESRIAAEAGIDPTTDLWTTLPPFPGCP